MQWKATTTKGLIGDERLRVDKKCYQLMSFYGRTWFFGNCVLKCSQMRREIEKS